MAPIQDHLAIAPHTAKREHSSTKPDQTSNLAFMRKRGFGSCSESRSPFSALKLQATDYAGATVVFEEWDATANDAVKTKPLISQAIAPQSWRS